VSVFVELAAMYYTNCHYLLLSPTTLK